MTARPGRGLVLTLVLALVAGGLSACRASGPATGTAAATVNGERITAAAVDQDLADIAENKPFLDARSEQGLAFFGTQPGTYDATVVAELLDRKVTALLVRQELGRRAIGPSPDDLRRVREELRAQLVDPASGASLLDGFPGRYVDEQARTQAESDVLQASEGRVALDEASLRAAYDAGADRFRVWCVRWIVAGETDPDAASRAVAAIAAGEDFAQVAQRESADQQSAGRGGALGCQTRAGLARLGDAFSEAVMALGAGQVSPLTTAEYGTFVVQVTDVKVRPFDEVRGVVRAQVLAPAQGAYEQLLRRLRGDARVTVTARYGTWEPADDGAVGIRPAGGPAASAEPGAPTTLSLTRLPSARGRPSP